MADSLLAMGLAVLTYDKRGVGAVHRHVTFNVGTARSIEVFGVLADDALAGVAALKARRDIDARRIGLGGASQAGWLTPLAASQIEGRRIHRHSLGSGCHRRRGDGYSRLAGADPGSIQGLADDEIDRQDAGVQGAVRLRPGSGAREAVDAVNLDRGGSTIAAFAMAQTLATLERLRDVRAVAITVRQARGCGSLI